MECFYCLKVIEPERVDMIWLGLDKPYINLPMHNSCHRKIRSRELEWLQENADRIVAEHAKQFVLKGEPTGKAEIVKKSNKKNKKGKKKK